MADTGAPAPIIIKKIKKGGGGHHGGAWKVAYADFVTAMMAFFLLLWLLSATTDEKKKGIADYFTPTIGVKGSKGIGFNGGTAPTKEGVSRSVMSPVGLVVGQVQQGPVAAAPDDETKKDSDDESENEAQGKSSNDDKQDSEMFDITEQEIKQALQKQDLEQFKDNVIVEESPEGLKIDVIDDPKKPMFAPGGAVLTDNGKKVLDSMANIILKTPNNIALNGHTDSASATTSQQYTNWELSSDRANTARRFLVSTQLESERIVRVVGMADKQLLVPNEPANPRNRRITIILVRNSYFRDPKIVPTTRTILSVPEPKVKEEPVPVVVAPVEPPKPTPMFDPTLPAPKPELSPVPEAGR